MVTEETLETLVERFAGMAREKLLAEGSHASMLFVIGERAAGIIMTDMPPPDGTRQAMFQRMGEVVQAEGGEALGGLVALIHVAEAWGRTMTSEEVEHREYDRIADDPQREEVLLIFGYNPSLGESVMRLYDMVRDGDEKLVDVVFRPPRADAEETHVAPYLLEAFAAGYEGREPKDFPIPEVTKLVD